VIVYLCAITIKLTTSLTFALNRPNRWDDDDCDYSGRQRARKT